MVDLHEWSADRVIFLAVDFAHERGIDDATQETGPEHIRIHMGEEEPDGRVEGDGEERCNGHGEVLVKARGLKSLPSIASRVNTGMNETAITRRAKKLGPPTSLTALMTTSL